MTNLTLASAGAAVARVGKWTLARLEEKSTYIGLAGIATALDHGEIAQHLNDLGTSGPLLLGALGVILAAATTHNPATIVATLPALDGAVIAAASDAGAPVPEHVHSLIESVEKLVTTLAIATPVVAAVDPEVKAAVLPVEPLVVPPLAAIPPAAPSAPIAQTAIVEPLPTLENVQ